MKVTNSHANPEQILDEQIAAMASADEAERCFALRFRCDQYYLPGEPHLHLIALVALSKRDAAAPRIEVAILGDQTELVHELESLIPERCSLMAFATAHGAAWVDLSAPLSLAPVKIPKPWGQEVWYTGVEARGQASVAGEGGAVALPWLLAFAPRRLAAERPSELILLKELHPHPQPVFGDLYFEVHRRKREAYVVTHLDADAWPDGVGGVRYGFNPEQRARYKDDDAFKNAYLKAVQAYEAVRREIDGYFDQQRDQAGLSATAPLPVSTLMDWQAQLPAELRATEQQLRATMERFIAVQPVRLGDVVTIPPLIPHGLLHGVRVIEFQTADYERQILSFGQKVLTQDRWDTAAILGEIPLEAPSPQTPPCWRPEPGVRVERLVQFPAFAVLRVHLEAGASVSSINLRRDGSDGQPKPLYALLMHLQGSLCWRFAQGREGRPMHPGQAQLLASCCEEGRICNQGETDATLLVAVPTDAR